MNPFPFLYGHRRILFRTAWDEVRRRYAGFHLGLFWMILHPLLFLGVYATVYVEIFKVKFQLFSTTEYVFLMFAGLIPALGFSEAIGAAVTSVTAGSNLVKNTLFPVELLPIRSLLAAQTTQLVSTLILLIALTVTGHFQLIFPLIVVIWFFQILFMTGLVWILAALNVFLRDIYYLVTVSLFLLLILSPIAYTMDMVPAKLRFWLTFNPVYYFVAAFQEILLFGRLPSKAILLPMMIVSLLFFQLGFILFRRLKPAFADYL